MKGKLHFKEIQHATQWWLWALIIGLDVVLIIFLFKEFWQEDSESIWINSNFIIVTIIVLLVSNLSLWIFRLETEIREEGVYVRVFPFHLQFVHYPWEEIEDIYVRKYKPLREYGGWGLRGFGKNRAFNAKGDMGIQLILQNGNKRLIGTSKPYQAENALEEAGKLEMKGQFSKQAEEYALFRPDYPDILFDTLYAHCKHFNYAWDCGCANGKVALPLADKFPIVYGTDISNRLLNYAPSHPNIIYRSGKSEEIQLNHKFDLITVAQAIHWFEFEPFYANIRRHLHPDGVLAVFGYGLLKINDECDQLSAKLFNDILNENWDPAIQYIREGYETIPFPFEELDTPEFTYNVYWTVDEVLGFFRSWSAVQNYIDQKGKNPIDLIRKDFTKAWGKDSVKLIQFPVFLRMGKMNST